MSEGRCPHCEAFIGLAVATHARHCELRPQAAAVLHDSEAAEKGECKCVTCEDERSGVVAW